jgi:methionine aminopeptidase
MKWVMIIAMTFSLSLFAERSKMGSKCGLVDNWGDVEDASTTYDFSRSLKQLKSLIKTVKSQLIAAAKDMDDKARITDVKDAVKLIKENSEGGDLYILKAEILGKKYSVISYYGGGNHTGYIFPWGKTKAVATIGDDDIVCVP